MAIFCCIIITIFMLEVLLSSFITGYTCRLPGEILKKTYSILTIRNSMDRKIKIMSTLDKQIIFVMKITRLFKFNEIYFGTQGASMCYLMFYLIFRKHPEVLFI